MVFIFTSLFLSNYYDLVGYEILFNPGMFLCLLVDVVKILTYFYAACLNGRQVGTFS